MLWALIRNTFLRNKKNVYLEIIYTGYTLNMCVKRNKVLYINYFDSHVETACILYFTDSFSFCTVWEDSVYDSVNTVIDHQSLLPLVTDDWKDFI